MSGVNLTAAQARALAAYAVPGRRLFIEQADEARIYGGPVNVAIGAQPSANDRMFRRLAGSHYSGRRQPRMEGRMIDWVTAYSYVRMMIPAGCRVRTMQSQTHDAWEFRIHDERSDDPRLNRTFVLLDDDLFDDRGWPLTLTIQPMFFEYAIRLPSVVLMDPDRFALHMRVIRQRVEGDLAKMRNHNRPLERLGWT